MKIARNRVYSGTKWEPLVAYSRALRTGPFVVVAGTTAVDDNGKVIGDGDVYEQTHFIFAKIARALAQCGATLKDVVRTRAFVTDITRFDEFAKAHREFFQGIDPVASCIEISRLVDPKLLIEIEVDAYLCEDSNSIAHGAT